MPGDGLLTNRVMAKQDSKRRIKLWLLAFVLAIVLTWYSINPAPVPIRQRERKDDPPDDARRQAHAHIGGTSLWFGSRATLQFETWHAAAAADDDMPDWPEYIELD